MSYYRIKELPEELRPRERLELYGASALSDAELIAILLRTGGKGISALDLAVKLLSEIGSLSELSQMSFSSLSRINHIGKAKAAQLLAAVEIGKRVFSSRLVSGVKLNSPAQVAECLKTEIGFLKEEVFGAFFLDNSNRILRKEVIHKGGRSSSVVDVASLLRRALEVSATRIIVFHNHPSGNLNPSSDDLRITRKIQQACSLIDMELLDHIIITSDGYLSLRDEGHL